LKNECRDGVRQSETILGLISALEDHFSSEIRLLDRTVVNLKNECRGALRPMIGSLDEIKEKQSATEALVS
jgi:hypothetical protein